MRRFKHYLEERILSIGFNDRHEKHREDYRDEIHRVIKKSYETSGGYGGLGSGTRAEHEAIHDDISNLPIKAVRRNGKITAVNVYKKQHGRKSIASGTDGSDQGKKDWERIKHEDNKQKRAWGEVSGAVEHKQKKMGVPRIPSSRAKELLGKDVTPVPGDEYQYSREIGGHSKVKTMMGHPQKS
jgi:hypothetical protein